MRQALVVFFLSAGDSVPCNLIKQRYVNRASFYKFNAHSDPHRPCLESHIELRRFHHHWWCGDSATTSILSGGQELCYWLDIGKCGFVGTVFKLFCSLVWVKLDDVVLRGCPTLRLNVIFV